MTERPILFSGEMVRAILNGRKTQTRRVVIRVNGLGKVSDFGRSAMPGETRWEMRDSHAMWNDLAHRSLLERCPYGIPGDLLWVKEGYQIIADDQDDRVQFRYAASPDSVYTGYLSDHDLGLWRKRKYPYRNSPGRFMYRSLARILLEVTDIRVERVQDISEDDAVNEGIRVMIEDHIWYCADGEHTTREPIYAFETLWDSINADIGYGWDVNPWVWVVEFRSLL